MFLYDGERAEAFRMEFLRSIRDREVRCVEPDKVAFADRPGFAMFCVVIFLVRRLSMLKRDRGAITDRLDSCRKVCTRRAASIQDYVRVAFPRVYTEEREVRRDSCRRVRFVVVGEFCRREPFYPV